MPSPLRGAHDPVRLQARWERLARRSRLRVRILARHDGHPIVAVTSPALRRTGGLYLSAGIHGDEPAAVQGLIEWAEARARDLADLPLLILPCLNPWGLVQNRRTDAGGVDVNRRWQTDAHPVVAAVRALTGPHRFDVALCLHEDYDAEGIYVYEPQRARPLWGPALLRAGKPHLPPDRRPVIEGRPACRPGLISARVTRAMFRGMGLPEAVWLHLEKALRTFTIETPSEAGLETRIAAQVAMLDAAFGLWADGLRPARAASARAR